MSQLFLDDERNPKDVTWVPMDGNWQVVRSVEEFTAAIKASFPTRVSFDHDLGPDPENTGFKAAKILVEYCMDNNLELPECQVHSKNPEGSANISSYLENFLRVCPRKPKLEPRAWYRRLYFRNGTTRAKAERKRIAPINAKYVTTFPAANYDAVNAFLQQEPYLGQAVIIPHAVNYFGEFLPDHYSLYAEEAVYNKLTFI